MTRLRPSRILPAGWKGLVLERVEQLVSPRLTMPAFAWYKWLTYEPELRRLSTWVQKGSVAIDVGANRGLWTWHMARLGARVHAFEPHPALAARLRRAVPSASVYPVALSDTAGWIQMRVPVANNLEVHVLGTIEHDNRFVGSAVERVKSIYVERKTLDTYRFEKVSFMKIDVEGHELAVLRGAKDTITRCRPTIIYEAEERHRPGTVEACRKFFAELGYKVLPSESAIMWLAVPL